jgi:Ala-tRNA(Pro) deacylase
VLYLASFSIYPRCFGSTTSPAPVLAVPSETMTDQQQALVSLLNQLQIVHTHFSHAAVFTTADVAKLTEDIPGSDTKNLFLRDEKRSRYILVCVRAETRVNLKELGKQLGIKGLCFATPDELQSLLGVTPGSVCLFALMNDVDGRVTGFLDSSITPTEAIQNHPLENTATIVLTAADIARFCAHAGHPLTRIEIPARIAAAS